MHPVSLTPPQLLRAQKAGAQPIIEFAELMHFALFAPQLPRTPQLFMRSDYVFAADLKGKILLRLCVVLQKNIDSLL
jgi:hypothetical protein